jgi:CDP-diacylglycerol--serine O-phosphatidyltransferase
VKPVSPRARAVAPTLLTLGNAVCGLAAIAFASKIGKVGTPADLNLFYMACSGWFLIAAMIFDALDGYVARLTGTAGPFGAELDSLCDAVSFGCAPAFLLIQLGPTWEQPLWHQVLVVAATLFLLATILRLARFNVESGQPAPPTGGKRFRGLPSPAAAGCVAALAVVRGVLPDRWPGVDPGRAVAVIETLAVLVGVTAAVLMVSSVSYPHPFRQKFGRRQIRRVVVPVIAVGLFGALLVQELMLVLGFWLFAMSGPLRAVWQWAQRGDDVPGYDDLVRH